jgi:hypothetical protein
MTTGIGRFDFLAQNRATLDKGIDNIISAKPAKAGRFALFKYFGPGVKIALVKNGRFFPCFKRHFRFIGEWMPARGAVQIIARALESFITRRTLQNSFVAAGWADYFD